MHCSRITYIMSASTDNQSVELNVLSLLLRMEEVKKTKRLNHGEPAATATAVPVEVLTAHCVLCARRSLCVVCSPLTVCRVLTTHCVSCAHRSLCVVCSLHVCCVLTASGGAEAEDSELQWRAKG